MKSGDNGRREGGAHLWLLTSAFPTRNPFVTIIGNEIHLSSFYNLRESNFYLALLQKVGKTKKKQIIRWKVAKKNGRY